MGGMESTVGFYNDRKIIQYEDGTVEYPTLETIPFYQKEERIKALLRIQSSEKLQETYNSLPASLAIDPEVIVKYVEDHPEEYYNTEEKRQKISDFVESISSCDSSTIGSARLRRSRRKSSKRSTSCSSAKTTSTISTDDDSESLLSRSSTSVTNKTESDGSAVGKIVWSCVKTCGILSLFRDYRKNRVHDEDLVNGKGNGGFQDLDGESKETDGLLNSFVLESAL